MKKLIHFTTAIIIACISISACQQTLTDTEKVEIEKELLELTVDIINRFNNRDTATVYTFYSEDFVLLSRGQYRITDPEQMQDFTASAKLSIATRDKTEYRVEEPRVEVYANNVANIFYTYTTTTTYDNDIHHETKSASTWTMVKENGDWRIKHAHISTGMDNYRAVEGEPVWVLLNKVAPDKREVFERFMNEVFFDKAKELGGIANLVMNHVRILDPENANEDGSYTYVFIMDPVISWANYDILSYLVQIYDEDEAQEKMKMFTGSLIEPQTRFVLTQSKY